MEKAFEEFKALADKKKDISDRDIEALVSDEVSVIPETFSLKSLDVRAGTAKKPSATVVLVHKGKTIKATETGSGPVDAVYKAITKLTKVKIKLVDYVIQAITGGTDALGEVMVRIRRGREDIFGPRLRHGHTCVIGKGLHQRDQQAFAQEGT